MGLGSDSFLLPNSASLSESLPSLLAKCSIVGHVSLDLMLGILRLTCLLSLSPTFSLPHIHSESLVGFCSARKSRILMDPWEAFQQFAFRMI